MGEPTQQSAASQNAGIDLSQFFQVFFEEAGENLEKMEQMLLSIDLEAADDETLNAIFRCAHSVKGGAATFGFADVAELTHQMETLLDKLRRHELQPSNAMVDVLLQSGDALKAQLARHQGSGDGFQGSIALQRAGERQTAGRRAGQHALLSNLTSNLGWRDGHGQSLLLRARQEAILAACRNAVKPGYRFPDNPSTGRVQRGPGAASNDSSTS